MVSEAEKRIERRRQQSKALSAVFTDPLDRFAASDSTPLRSVSLELANKEDNFKVRIRAVSDQNQTQLGSFNPPRAQSFVQDREAVVEELAAHLKSTRNVVKEARANNAVDRKTAKMLLSITEEVDADILKERAALAKNRMKLEYAILSHPAHSRIGEAYLSAIDDKLGNFAGATFNVQGSRNKHDQEQFRALLTQAYSPSTLAPAEDALWCPFSRAWVMSEAMTAAHIVSYAVGEVNASYIFGLPQAQGYEAIWSYKNGLLLQTQIENAFDAAQIVIVPIEDSSDEFKLVVLDESLLAKNAYFGGPKYQDLHDRKLEFITDSRPGKRFLYFQCLITLFRRFRHGVEGYEKDQEKIKMGQVWGKPGKWISQGILRALALEIGDIARLDTAIEGVLDVSSLADKLVAEKDRTVAVQVREAVEGVTWDEC